MNIELDSPEIREASIGKLLEQLREDASKHDEKSVEARSNTILMDVLPQFYRALDRERRRLAEEITTDQGLGVPAKDSKAIDRFLMVMTMPLINMAFSTVQTVVPQGHGRVTMQHAVFGNIVDNFRLNVMDMLRQPRGANGSQGH